MNICLNLDTRQRIRLAVLARRGIVYHADLIGKKYTVFVRHCKDVQGLSSIVISDTRQEVLTRMPLDAWHAFCQDIAQTVAQEALTSLQKPLVSAMSTQERARWLHSTKMWHVHTGISGRQAKRLAVYELQALDALQSYGKSLLSKEAHKARTQDKPARQIAHVKSRAASASSRVLFRQKMDSQGKGQAIPAKKQDSLSPAIKIRKHS